MGERADHPQQAAVHLMKALRCCRDCYAVSQIDYAELAELQRQKDKLALDLAQIGNPTSDLERMRAQVHDLQYLIQKVKEENQIAYQSGLGQIQKVVRQRELYQKQLGESFQVEIIAERQRNKTLTIQIQKQMEHIRYLHRVNEELVGKFCKY